MKICIIADAQSAHTKRWAQSISQRGHEVIIISFRVADIEGVLCHTLKTPRVLGISHTTPLWARFHYLFARRTAQVIVDDFNPDIVHAFTATSYGFLGARLKTRRFFVSVWGMDITDSPKNMIMRQIVKYTLKHAEKIFCTSRFLLDTTRALVADEHKLIQLPFGVDVAKFLPNKTRKDDRIVIGTSKSFGPKYGLMLLLEAFKKLCDHNDNLELRLINYQPQNLEAQNYIKSNLNREKIVFDDPMDNDAIPEFLNKMDIFVMPSRVESFGVAALEASACKLPIVATTVGGIPEVVVDGVTGILFGDNDVVALTDALSKLINDSSLRLEMGAAGRAFVMDKYVWHKNVENLLVTYTEACSQKSE